MIRIAALTEGIYVPSSRFRVRQYIGELARYGVVATDFARPFTNDRWQRLLPDGLRIRHLPPLWPAVLGVEALQLASLAYRIAATHRYDVTWLSRHLYLGPVVFERLLKKPLVLDVDDSIWLNTPDSLKTTIAVAKSAAKIIVGNQYLADWFSTHNKNITIAATAIDTARFCPIGRDGSQPFTIGWTGTSSNFEYLFLIRDALAAFLSQAPDARVLIVSDKKPALHLPHHRVEFLPWTASSEAGTIQQMDVGLMPLADNAWTRGKCSFKMLQYMACGRPVVVSPVGMNNEILAKGSVGFGATSLTDWVDALTQLYWNRSMGEAMGRNGRLVVEREYSTQVVAKIIADALVSAA